MSKTSCVFTILFSVLFFLLPMTAHADNAQGSACTPPVSGAIGNSTVTDGNNLVCISGTWQYPVYVHRTAAASAGSSCSTYPAGSLRYNSTLSGVEFCNGTVWNVINSATPSGINVGCGVSGTLHTAQLTTLTVASGCHVTFKAWGAGGGGGPTTYAYGGGGGYATITLGPLGTATTYYLVVGGGGNYQATSSSSGLNGYIGGGCSGTGTYCSSGGSASGVWTSSYGGTAVVIAGGGGGAAYGLSGMASNGSSGGNNIASGNAASGGAGGAGTTDGGGGGGGNAGGKGGTANNVGGGGGTNYAASGGSTTAGPTITSNDSAETPANYSDTNHYGFAGFGSSGSLGSDGEIYYSTY